MKRVIKNRPEEVVQLALLNHLRARSMPGLFYFHVPNGQNLPVHIKTLRKRMGVVSGVPDMMFVHRGAIYGLELKANKSRKASPEQVAAMNALEVAGARTAIAHNLQEALTTLEYWGLLRRDQNFGVSEAQSQESIAS